MATGLEQYSRAAHERGVVGTLVIDWRWAVWNKRARPRVLAAWGAGGRTRHLIHT